MVQKVSIDFCRKVVKKRFYNKIPVTVTVSEYQEGFDAKWPHFTILKDPQATWAPIFSFSPGGKKCLGNSGGEKNAGYTGVKKTKNTKKRYKKGLIGARNDFK